ncbi:MAG: acyl-ACP--UDP-N-acetylglucosamine O-acyltransferase [Planctomycetota bacterium]
MPAIHPTAIIDPTAQIHDEARIGPFCVIEGACTVGPGTQLISNVHLRGPITIGCDTMVYPGACLGFEPQDVKFKPGDPTAGVVVGDGCLIREHVTVHSATNTHTPTTIGNRVFMMSSSHAGHDCLVGDDAVIISGALLAGHVTIGERATLGGGALVHQFVRVGRLAMIGGGVAISNELPPYCTAYLINRIGGANLVGLRRSGMAPEEINAVKRAVNHMRADMPREDLLAVLDELAETSEAVGDILAFVESAERPICGGGTKKARGA